MSDPVETRHLPHVTIPNLIDQGQTVWASGSVH